MSRIRMTFVINYLRKGQLVKRYGKLIDLTLLILAGFLLNLFQHSVLNTVLSTLFAVSIASLGLFENYPKLQAAVCALLAVIALIWSPVLSFTSIVVYFAIQHTWRTWLLLALVPSLVMVLQASTPLVTSLLFLQLGLAAWLSFHTDGYLKMSRALLEAKDKHRELQLHYQSDREQWEILRLSEAKTATLEERARIAREMHDSVGHVLTRAILQTAALNKLNKDSSLVEPLTALEETLGSGMTQTRASLHQLRDDAQDLYREMELLCQSYPDTHFKVNLNYELTHMPPLAYQQAFIANTKEALTNVQKHSNATKVLVRLREYSAFYQLVVQDNGVASAMGLPEDAYFKEGMGLESMRLRCEALGGNFIIRKERGFGIFMTLPKVKAESKYKAGKTN